MLESKYQADLIIRIRKRFPGSVILKNDSSYMQGVPDLTVLLEIMWAVLEVKTSANAPEQPNQRYYVERMHEMSFGRFIYPSNEEEVLDELQQTYESRRAARFIERQ
jgi:hypothetical protein